jgi:hypothetical protein
MREVTQPLANASLLYLRVGLGRVEMSFACRLGRNTALEATSRSWTTGASSRGFHIAATCEL